MHPPVARSPTFSSEDLRHASIADVVLLDIGLPIVSGYEVAKWIRQEPTLKNVRLVALTGYGQESDRQRTQDAGFDQHLVKPADFAKVKNILVAVAEMAQ